MTVTPPANPYWTSRSVTEKVFESQGLKPGAILSGIKGQHWHIPGGPTFAIQWLGENDEMVDQIQVSFILEQVADWRAKNPHTLN